MPDFPFSRIAMMPDPNVGAEVLQAVVANHIIAVADHLEHEQVFPVRQHESSFVASRGIEHTIEPVRVLVDNFVLDGHPLFSSNPVLLPEKCKLIRTHPDKVAPDIWRSNLQAWN